MTRPVRQAVLALGSNLGDRRDILQGGADAVAGLPEVRVTAASPVYETVPVGGPPQPDYLNAVLLVATSLPPAVLLGRLHEIEAAFDRVRLVRWGPRTLDLDLIAYDDVSIQKPELTLPHPRLFERAFVLVPLSEIAPDRLIAGRSIKAALAGLKTEGIERLPDLG